MEGEVMIFRRITINDKYQVMYFFRECPDYFELTEGVQPDNCDEFFYDLPPNKTKNEKYLFGAFKEDTLIGVVDLVADFPEKGEWIIGLLLIHPNARGMGLGRAMHNEIKKFVKNQGGKKLRIGVMEQNVDALVFWSKIGYKQTKITEPRKFGIKESKVVVMNYYF